MKKSIFLISVLILAGCIIPLTSGQSYPSIEVTFENEIVTATPGNQGYVTLNIKSAGSETVEGIVVTGTSNDYWTITPRHWRS